MTKTKSAMYAVCLHSPGDTPDTLNYFCRSYVERTQPSLQMETYFLPEQEFSAALLFLYQDPKKSQKTLMKIRDTGKQGVNFITMTSQQAAVLGWETLN